MDKREVKRPEEGGANAHCHHQAKPTDHPRVKQRIQGNAPGPPHPPHQMLSPHDNKQQRKMQKGKEKQQRKKMCPSSADLRLRSAKFGHLKAYILR